MEADSYHDSSAGYAAELQAACASLQAQKPELENLLVPMHAARLPPRQTYTLLKRSWLRLVELRDSHAKLAGSPGRDPELSRLIEQAFAHLQPGDTFSLNACDTALERACRRCLEIQCEPRIRAAILAAQAQNATIRLDYRRAADLYAEAASSGQLELSLQWRYQLLRATALEEAGREFMDPVTLEEAVALYETRVLELAPREQRPHDWVTTRHSLGNARHTLGLHRRGTWLLERAIADFEDALTVCHRQEQPLQWAAIRNSLGYAQGTLAQRHADTDMLEQSVNNFEAALEVQSREKTPQEWAITQNNLGAALLTLGQRKKDKAILKRATDAYRSVLLVWTRNLAPQDWAMTMDNLGTALRALGEYRKGPRTLEQSIAAYRSALSVRTREHVPREWAITQNNLGAALYKLGEREQDARHLQDSINAYDDALKEWTPEHGPAPRVMTLGNQAAARKSLAQLTGDIKLIHQALSDFREIGNVFRSASHAQHYELVVEQVALLRKLEQQILRAERT